MGKHYKVYLTNVETDGLELLQAQRKGAGKPDAANAVFKEALRAVLVEEGVLEWRPGMGPGQPALLQVAKPEAVEVEEVSAVDAGAVRRRRRRG